MPAFTQETLERYSPGGDIYANLEAQYGKAGAERVYTAAKKDPSSISATLAQLRNGPPLEESTAKIFGQQIITDPLGAPLDSANKAIGAVGGSAIAGLFRNPWVLLVVAAVIFNAFGGFKWLAAKWKLA